MPRRPEVEDYIDKYGLESSVAWELRRLPHNGQGEILKMQLDTVNNASSALKALMQKMKSVADMSPEVEEYLDKCDVELHAAWELRALPRVSQQVVMKQGLHPASDASSLLLYQWKPKLHKKVRNPPRAVDSM